MTSFKKLLKELEDAILEKKVLGTIYTLMTDHMIRKKSYYIIKLFMISDIKNPECNPRKPRIKI